MIKIFKADLHCHTTCSDGSYSPADLITLSKSIGLNGLSITDHDSVSAYEQALPLAHQADLPLISGVEFSTIYRNTSIHILGYAFSLSNHNLLNFCNLHRERRQQRNAEILDKLQRHGLEITLDEVLACSNHPSGMIGRPHIAQAMVKKGYVDSIPEAFKSYIGEERPCYAKGKEFTVEETLNIIHGAGGLAIIAHPHLIKDFNITQELMRMNFDGLEGYYAQISSDKNDRWVRLASKKNWLITGGSDFHGEMKPSIPLGAAWTREETFNILYQRFLQV